MFIKNFSSITLKDVLHSLNQYRQDSILKKWEDRGIVLSFFIFRENQGNFSDNNNFLYLTNFDVSFKRALFLNSNTDIKFSKINYDKESNFKSLQLNYSENNFLNNINDLELNLENFTITPQINFFINFEILKKISNYDFSFLKSTYFIESNLSRFLLDNKFNILNFFELMNIKITEEDFLSNKKAILNALHLFNNIQKNANSFYITSFNEALRVITEHIKPQKLSKLIEENTDIYIDFINDFNFDVKDHLFDIFSATNPYSFIKNHSKISTTDKEYILKLYDNVFSKITIDNIDIQEDFLHLFIEDIKEHNKDLFFSLLKTNNLKKYPEILKKLDINDIEVKNNLFNYVPFLWSNIDISKTITSNTINYENITIDMNYLLKFNQVPFDNHVLFSKFITCFFSVFSKKNDIEIKYFKSIQSDDDKIINILVPCENGVNQKNILDFFTFIIDKIPSLMQQKIKPDETIISNYVKEFYLQNSINTTNVNKLRPKI